MENWEQNEDKIPEPLMVRSSRPIDIEFDNIKYTVTGPKGKKNVIKGVSGLFKSGEITAIMGPSGAGKSSLLNILTGFREAEGSISSSLTSKKSTGTKQYSKYSCYILQDNCLDPLFTVEETMMYAAHLKLGTNIPKDKKKLIIEETLKSLMLWPSRNTRCASLSGGQQKRLSVALELIGNPSVMFLDEPTTGLDSSSSLQVIRMLKKLADQGRNIVCTIHQPSAALFEMFDFVYVMTDGICIYQGASRNVVSYLASFGLNCPHYHNPADFLLEVANAEYGNFTKTLEVKGKDDNWRNETKRFSRGNSYSEHDNHCSERDPSNEMYKLWILTRKSFFRMTRDWTISSLKVLLHMVVGCFLGVFYMNAGRDASKMITNLGFLLCTLVYLGYTSLMPAVVKFPSELNILKKEQYNNWYKLRTYYAAHLLVDISMQISFVLSYVSGAYLLSGQPLDLERFLRMILILFFVCMVASSMGIFFGTIVDPINGTFLGAITLALMLVVAGFLILFTHMSSSMYLLSYVSYISYAMEALAQSLYGFNREHLPCPEDVIVCPYGSPEELLKIVGMDKPNYWKDVMFLVCNFIGIRIVAFCTLRNNLSKV